MRFVFSILLLWIIFNNISANNKSLKEKIEKMASSIRKLSIQKELLRYLQSTDQISDTEYPEGNSTDTGPETEDAETPNFFVLANRTASSVPADTTDKTNGIQILSLFNIAVADKSIEFGLSAFFYNRPISSMVIFRLRVTYNYKTGQYDRIPEEAESVKTVCTIKNRDLINYFTEGDVVEYVCKAESAYNAENSHIEVNRDVKFKAKNDTSGEYEEVNFADITFDGNSSAQADNIEEVPYVSKAFYLKDGEITYKGENNLKIRGFINNNNQKLDISEIPMSLSNVDEKGNENKKTYMCRITYPNPSNYSDVELDCDIDQPLTTNEFYLNFNDGYDSGKHYSLTIQMKQGFNDTLSVFTIYVTGDTYRYRKNSSGLTPASIAGIVIACVVVLIAASIVAILLKRPKKEKEEEENTTIAGLKSAES